MVFASNVLPTVKLYPLVLNVVLEKTRKPVAETVSCEPTIVVIAVGVFPPILTAVLPNVEAESDAREPMLISVTLRKGVLPEVVRL